MKLPITSLVCATIILNACGPITPEASPSTPPVKTSTPLPITTVSTNFPTNISTPTVPTPTAQLILTSTAIPTLPENIALEAFSNLIEKNNECNLPCWLAVVPGQTKFEDVENEFSQFGAIASTKFSPESAYIRVFFPNFDNAIHNTVTEVYSTKDGEISQIWVYAGVNQKEVNDNITYSNPEFQKLWRQYFVPGIFTKYGPPEKIFLDTTLLSADPATSYPFVLWIIYPKQGFLMRYEGNNAIDGENIKICPVQSRIEIKIWDIETSNYEEFMTNDEAGGISLGPQPIENVTNFDIESFYETFKQGQLDTCFETPASIWPPN